VDDMKVGVLFRHRPDSAQGYQMLAANQQGKLSILQDGLGSFGNILQSRLGASEAQLQVAAVKNSAVHQVFVLVGAVGFDAEALVAHGGGAEPGAGAEAGGGVKGGPEEDDFCLLIGGIAGDKGFYIGR